MKPTHQAFYWDQSEFCVCFLILCTEICFQELLVFTRTEGITVDRSDLIGWSEPHSDRTNVVRLERDRMVKLDSTFLVSFKRHIASYVVASRGETAYCKQIDTNTVYLTGVVLSPWTCSHISYSY